MRGDSIDLHAIVHKLSSRPPSSIRYLHLYTDKLTFKGPIDDGVAQLILPSNQPLSSIRIFARSFLCDDDIKGIRVITGGANFRLFIFFHEHKEEFLVINESNVSRKLSKHLAMGDQEISCVQPIKSSSTDAVVLKISMADTHVGRRFIFSSSDMSSARIDNLSMTELEPLSKDDLNPIEPRIRRNQYVPIQKLNNFR